MRFLLRLRDLCLDFLFPKSQQVVELEALSTESLLKALPPAAGPELDEHTLALFDYGHPLVKEIIWEMKYGGNRIVAGKLGELLYDVIVSELEERNILPVLRSLGEAWEKYHPLILMPMPISDRRRYERGWNQAELLTEAIKARDQGGLFKHLPRQLAKVRHTESQTKTANKRERMHNLEHSMKVLNSLSVAGKLVVIIDDVITTGSTFAEAKRALRSAGARKVLCIAVAH